MSKQDILDTFTLVRKRTSELRNEVKEELKNKYLCVRDFSNEAMHLILTDVYGPIDRGDRSFMERPLEDGSMKIAKKEKLVAKSGIDHFRQKNK